MTQEEFEKSVFESFIQVAPFGVVEGTIRNRRPPEPDIICEVIERGTVGFELTELIDQSHRERIALMHHTATYLDNYWRKELNNDQSETFYNKYKGALLYFDFAHDSRLNERKPIIATAFRMLLDLPDNSGGLHFENHKELSSIYQY